MHLSVNTIQMSMEWTPSTTTAPLRASEPIALKLFVDLSVTQLRWIWKLIWSRPPQPPLPPYWLISP